MSRVVNRPTAPLSRSKRFSNRLNWPGEEFPRPDEEESSNGFFQTLLLQSMDAGFRRFEVDETQIGLSNLVAPPSRAAEKETIVDVMAASVLEATEDRLLFHFQDRLGNSRDGWMSRSAVPLEVEVGMLLQILVIADGNESRLRWQLFEQPSFEDYQETMNSLPAFSAFLGS